MSPNEFWLLNEQVRYMESYVRKERNFCPQEWLDYYPTRWEDQDENEDLLELE